MHTPTIQRTVTEPQPDYTPGASGSASLERLHAHDAPLAGLVVKGTLLSIVTLGIYRFWYKTALRRYYWHNTRLAGDAFEYTGTGKELFIGFLIALAIVLPLYFVVTLIGLYGGQVAGPVIATLVGSIVMPAVVVILSFRARRYRLVRTRFRGIRFHQTGTGTAYLLRTLKWLLLTALTLGILFPYLRRALERYKIENTWYGSAQGAFSAPVKPLMKAWLLFWGALFLGLLSSVLIGVAAAAGSDALTGLASFAGVVLLVSLPFLWIAYRVKEFRSFVGGTSFNTMTFQSDLMVGSVVWTWVRYYLILAGIVIALGLTALIFSLLVAGDLGEHGMWTFFEEVQGGIVVAGLGIVAFVLASVVTELAFRRRLWALRISSLTLTNLSALDAIVQTAGQDATGIGEAFDSGFDIAG